MRWRGFVLAMALAAGAIAASAEPAVLSLPSEAEMLQEQRDVPGRYGVATAVWNGHEIPKHEVNGVRQRSAWRVPNTPGALTGLMRRLTEDLQTGGFEILLSCNEASCGGFDFRHGLDVLPLPAMYVDLGRFRYIALARSDAGVDAELVALLASASGDTVHLQIDRITPLPADPPVAPAQTVPAVGAPEPSPRPGEALPERPTPEVWSIDGIAAAFADSGEIVLEDLSFASGSTALGAGSYRSLDALAAYLEAQPTRRIAVVGHTDSTGSAAANIAVSTNRAEAVAARLTGELGIARSRLVVQGAGLAAPRDTNLTEAGRARNRRVTAVLLP